MMFRKGYFICLLGLSINTAFASHELLKTQEARNSYVLGVIAGKNLKQQNLDVNLHDFNNGLIDAYNDKALALSKAQIAVITQQLHQEMIEKKHGTVQDASEKNLKTGEAFLKTNEKKPDIKTLSNGIQYQVIEKGNGPKPTSNAVVTVDYEGKLLDGQVFDSSYQRGEPATFPLKHVIAGWQAVLPLMETGATWIIYIPPELAYGAHGVPGVIPPNSLLIFKIHLKKVHG